MERALRWLEEEEGDSDFVPSDIQVKLFLQVCETPQVLTQVLAPKLLLATTSSNEEEEFTRAKSMLRLAVAIAVRFAHFPFRIELHELLISHANHLQSEISFLERLGNCSNGRVFPLYTLPTGIPSELWQRKAPQQQRLAVERKRVVWSSSNELSLDTLGLVFAFLDSVSLCSAARACKFWLEAETQYANALWDRLLLVRWPNVVNGGGKSRYFKRLGLLRHRPAPKLGRRLAQQVLFCGRCDAIFTREFSLARHVCEINKPPPRKRIRRE
ncbi:hypothetical protein BASA81_001509 [Batrachochytrium salamandrivorans]|nr:hypothetical protein BASA81_001509 [Batrachochytrium salamandrivorans]